MIKSAFNFVQLYRAIQIGLLCVPVLLISGNASSKDFYKWQDDDGITHYSAHPPRNDRAAEKVRATNITGSAAPTNPNNSKKDAETAATEEAEPSKKNSERCAIAQKNLKTLEERSRVRVKDGDSTRFLTPDEKQEMTESTRAQIKESC